MRKFSVWQGKRGAESVSTSGAEGRGPAAAPPPTGLLPRAPAGTYTKPELIPFARPDIGADEIAEVVDTLRSGWITSGPKVRQFEEEFGAILAATSNASQSTRPRQVFTSRSKPSAFRPAIR